VLRFESRPSGEIVLDARGATVAAALDSMAASGGFEVAIDRHIPRPLLNLTVRAGSIEDALRQILRDRNYAFVYDADTEALETVIVLPPSVPRAPGRASPNRPSRWRAGARR
jgi:hypothetical protein